MHSCHPSIYLFISFIYITVDLKIKEWSSCGNFRMKIKFYVWAAADFCLCE